MRNSKASKKRHPTKSRIAKRTTSRRATTSRSRTSRTARRTRRVSPKSIPPRGLIEIPKLLEQAVAATPPLPSKRYPIRNLLVLFLAFAATTAVGGWAVYVALFGGAHQNIESGTPPVIVDVRPEEVPSADLPAPKAQDRVAATPTEAAIPSISQEPPPAPAALNAQDRIAPAPSIAAVSSSAPETPPLPPESLEVTAAAIPEPPGGSTAGSSGRQVPITAKSKRRQRADSTAALSPGGPVSSAYALVTEARRYLGTNPTGRKDLWCGAFLDMVLKRIGYKGGGNLASAYARYGTRLSGPQIGAIAVMWRQGGGHVGIVTGLDKKGNPIIISGNYQKRVAEAVYPRGRIYAYVIPDDRQRMAAARAQVTADDLR